MAQLIQARNQNFFGGGGGSKIRVNGPSRSTARERRDQAGGGSGRGNYPSSQSRENFAFGALKTVSDAYFMQITRILFPPNSKGMTITSSVQHAVSDIFIIMFRERAKRASACRSGFSYFNVSESNIRSPERSEQVGGWPGHGMALL